MKKITQIIKLLIIILLISFFTSCQRGIRTNDVKKSTTSSLVMVFAAASLTDVLTEVVDSFEVRYGVQVKTNMASSGTLARQIEQGEIPDIYISASEKWADYIDSLGFILQNNKTEIISNELVLIAPLNSTWDVISIDSSLNFISLLGSNRLSLGDPAHVPAGKYAKQSLEYYGWYDQLDDHILPAKDVRSALMVVEMEESPVGIVYRTDALKSDKVKILGIFPEKSHKPIVYVAGLCNDNKTAKDFFIYLKSNAIKPIWEKHGFKK